MICAQVRKTRPLDTYIGWLHSVTVSLKLGEGNRDALCAQLGSWLAMLSLSVPLSYECDSAVGYGRVV